MHQILINLEKCNGCKKCVDTCFADVIYWSEKSKRPYTRYPEECATCNWCEIKCAAGAIRVVPDNPVPYPEYYPESIYPLA